MGSYPSFRRRSRVLCIKAASKEETRQELIPEKDSGLRRL
jgi:hypothetical protein